MTEAVLVLFLMLFLPLKMSKNILMKINAESLMIKVSINSAEVTAALDKLSNKVKNLSPVYDAIGLGMVENIRLGISEGETPWGETFQPLKSLRRNNQNPRVADVPLNNTRQHLYNKITSQAGSKGVEIGIFENAPIGITHQFGSQKKNIPARPFLPINQAGEADLPADWQEEILSAIQAHIDQAL